MCEPGSKMIRFLCAFFLISLYIQTNKAETLCELFESTHHNISEACLKQMHVVCNTPELGFKLFDASSKFLTPGMSYSNVIDYGNFPECLSIDYNDGSGRILGKFCGISHVIVNVFLTTESEKILTDFGIDTNTSLRTPRIISSEAFSKMSLQLKDILVPDVPYVLSKYSSCVPDACTPREVGHFFWFAYILSDLVPLLIYTDLTCETVYSNTDYQAGDICMIIFLVLIAILMIASTVYDALLQNFGKKPYHPLLLSFSILFNGKKLLYISDNKTEQIQIFNGMRFISMMWVMAFHAVSVFQAGLISLENFPEAKEWDSSLYNRYIMSGLLSVDTFFFMAGFLLAFTYLKSAETCPWEQLKKVPKMYLHRYLRLTPSVGVMFLVLITIYRFMGKGPTWTLIANFMKDGCVDKWWKFFLYIQNYTDPDTMCVNPTWYLSADMQMFILSPIVLIPMATYIRKSFKWVFWGLVGLTLLSILIPMLTRYFVDEVAGNIYTAHERFSDFLIGITFGATMRMYKHKPFIFSPLVNLILWIVVLVVSLAFNLYWFDVLNYYDLLKYTLFMGFYRPIWCLCLVFMVYSCYHDHGGIVQWFLSWPSFQVLGRLSYSMYVLHVLVELYAAGTLKTTSYFSNYFLFYNFCGHIIITLIVSVIWVLAFEYPMLTIDKYLLGDDKRKPTKKAAEQQ